MQKIINAQNTVSAKKPKSRIKITTIIAVLVLVTLVGIKLKIDVDCNELVSNNAELRSEIQELQSENTRLNVELESKTSLTNVEERAITELGLYKIEKYQYELFVLPGEDKVVNSEKESNSILESIGRGFSTILEFLS